LLGHGGIPLWEAQGKGLVPMALDRFWIDCVLILLCGFVFRVSFARMDIL
jgi:hypothetical protein